MALRRFLLILVGVCLCLGRVFADETDTTSEADSPRVAWLKQNAIPVRTIDPADDDYSDLMPLVEKIGTARIVALGEQSHGDGATFVAKHRLVRFLHQRMGFDVLAWESGLFDCRQTDIALQAGRSAEEAEGIFPIWHASGHVRPVLQYAASTANTGERLEIAGFDCQFSSQTTAALFPAAVQTFFARFDEDAVTTADLETLRKIVNRQQGQSICDGIDSQAFIDSLIKRLDEKRTAAERVHSRREMSFMRRMLVNLKTLDGMRQRQRTGDPSETNMRDRAMAENLAWLANEYYPDRKIIVWAASFHLMRNAAQVQSLDNRIDYSETSPMGEVAHKLLGDDYYSVMFIAHDGSKGNPFTRSSKLDRPPDGSLEALLHAAGSPFAFVDFRSLPNDHWLREPLLSRPLGYSPMRAEWPRSFDGVFFTKTMFPSTRDGDIPREFHQVSPESDDSIADTLEGFRQTLIGYQLGFDSVFPKTPWRGHDASRLADYPDAAWPNVLGYVHTDPLSFNVIRTASDIPKKVAGPQAFMVPVDGDIETGSQYTTLLALKGVTSEGSLVFNTYVSLICQGDMRGRLFFDSYATCLVNGKLSGRVTGKSYMNLVVTGEFTGRVVAQNFAMIYLLGGLAGEMELHRSKVYIAGRTERADLSRITGRGQVFLEKSDLPAGVHSLGDLEVTVDQTVSVSD